MSVGGSGGAPRIVCNFCAAMIRNEPLLAPALLTALLATLWGAPAAQAAKTDRAQPFVIQSDNGGEGNKISQRTRLSGNVVISQGTLQLRAESVDLRITADGFHQALASGTTDKPVSFSQGRDVPGESVQGQADQVEFDTKSDTVRFIGNAVVRRLQGTTVADEVTGAVILFDNRSEVFTLEGGQTSPHPSGRVRVVMMPRGGAPEAASAPAAAASGVQLKPSTSLSPRKAP